MVQKTQLRLSLVLTLHFKIVFLALLALRIM
jgi:hypothetical protein